MIALFDTHKAVKSLHEHGFTEEQAEAITELLRGAQGEADLATRRDMKELELALKQEVKLLEEHLRAEMWKALAAQGMVLIGVMVAFKIFA